MARKTGNRSVHTHAKGVEKLYQNGLLIEFFNALCVRVNTAVSSFSGHEARKLKSTLHGADAR